MLRITVRNESAGTRFLVEGKLAGGCVGELEKCWQAARSDKSQGTILVDLAGVTFIDACGKKLLTRMHERGIRLVATGIMLNSMIEEIENARSTGEDCAPLE